MTDSSMKKSNAAIGQRCVMAIVCLICTAQIKTASAQAVDAPADVRKVLYANDELLLTAIHRGDRNTWARLTTSDFMYVEEGEVSRRDQFLKELEDDGLMPLIIRNYEVKVIGDTAQVFHQDDVPQRPGRVDERHSHLLMTETWQRIHGQWRLRLVHTDRIRINPPPILLTSQQIDELVGTYRSANVTYIIKRDGHRILGGRAGEPLTELMAETRDVLFQPDNVYLRRVFQRDAKGHVTGFIDRRETDGRSWARVSSG
ncbi:nuclear transport factor 2 family protein [Dyella monticola]|uniref:Nuclear transport factor 2 family protein n=1 Tax=Dyella monticola TaxID=1927958 RepID=A0A370X1V5_9GAMM|nr:nuclear transport factor 2 family protein [Dyella monticola]RDS82260.1 nuclear transport factor 2 family protein [Dyella monticola]